MAARKIKGQINLLPQEEFAGTTFGRTLKWAMSTFRIIVIATEMVVMIAFLSRFWLDARNSDLNDLIKQKTAVLASQSDFEKEFKNTQKKLSIFSSLTAEAGTASKILGNITSYLPSDIYLITYAFNGESAQVKGAAQSEISIAQFMVNLEKSEAFDKVTLTNLDASQEDSLFTFTLRVIPKKGGK